MSSHQVVVFTSYAWQVKSKIQVTGKDIEVTPAMRDYVFKKLGKVRLPPPSTITRGVANSRCRV